MLFSHLLFRTFHYFKHQLTGSTAHGIHSPFIYQLVTQVLRNNEINSDSIRIEELRKLLYRNDSQIKIEKIGAKSSFLSSIATVSKIVKISSSQSAKGNVLYKLAKFAKPRNIIELGTNLGIGSAYLALGYKDAEIFTVEGNKELHEIAGKNLDDLKLNRVTCIHALFDDVFFDLLRQNKTVDMLFVDGNHTYDATLRYFKTALPFMSEKGIIIFDDIYWSPEMYRAWKEIQQSNLVTATVDVYSMGIVFLNKDLSKQSFKIKIRQTSCL